MNKVKKVKLGLFEKSVKKIWDYLRKVLRRR